MTATRPLTKAARTIPDGVSKEIPAVGRVRSRTKAAKQRAPLPHISATPPSLLKNRQRQSATPFGLASSNKSPSAPTPRCRSHKRRTGSPLSRIEPSRLSIRIKSFPAPFILVKAIRIPPKLPKKGDSSKRIFWTLRQEAKQTSTARQRNHQRKLSAWASLVSPSQRLTRQAITFPNRAYSSPEMVI